METRKVIAVWPDTGSDDRNTDGSYKWIVSLDEIDATDRAETIKLIASRPTADKAMIAARIAATLHDLPIRLWKDDNNGGGYVDVER